MRIGNDHYTGLFKVTGPNGEACFGGLFTYNLPNEAGEPGAWTTAYPPVICESGYHLTTTPHQWRVPCGSTDREAYKQLRLWVAEGRGRTHQPAHSGDKISCESIRLLQEVTPEWGYFSLCPSALLWLYLKGAISHDDMTTKWRGYGFSGLPGKISCPPGTDLSHLVFNRCDFTSATLRGVCFSHASIHYANFDMADLSEVNLYDAHATTANFGDANLSWSNLSCSNLAGADLRCRLIGANLRYANLHDVLLTSTPARLHGADFTGAICAADASFLPVLSSLGWLRDNAGRLSRATTTVVMSDPQPETPKETP